MDQYLGSQWEGALCLPLIMKLKKKLELHGLKIKEQYLVMEMCQMRMLVMATIMDKNI